ncbi:MAG: hypothetical protein R3C25_08440 [Hyphomonadaceae bacterium]
MANFLSSLTDELGARRRRLRVALGDRGQALAEFVVLAGLVLGSLGLFVRPWMASAAPWGFWLPPVFLAGYFLIDWRRQRALARGGDAGKVTAFHDWASLSWSAGCALAGAAAFVIAFTSEPAPAPVEEWAPPESAVSVDISP